MGRDLQDLVGLIVHDIFLCLGIGIGEVGDPVKGGTAEMADEVAGSLAPVQVNDMDPDGLYFKSGGVCQDKQLQNWHDKDDPDHDLVPEELDELFSNDAGNGSHDQPSL